jgi:hypothetical protein
MRQPEFSQLRSLIQESIPELARWWLPRGHKNLYRVPDSRFLLALKRMLGWPQRRRWGVYVGSKLGGILEVEIAPSRTHHLDILLHPDLRPTWTRPLLTFGLGQLRPYGPQATTVHLYDYQSDAIQVLQNLASTKPKP